MRHNGAQLGSTERRRFLKGIGATGATLLFGSTAASASDEDVPLTAADKPTEGPLGPFMGEPSLDRQQIFQGERFPNIVVTTDGTVLAAWGSDIFRVRRSEDAGETWGPVMTLGQGIQGGGATVDENTGDVLLFMEESHPPAPRTMYRSTDDGKTWQEQEVNIEPNSLGHVPSLHMNESGITLRHGSKAGRLVRPSRWYADANVREEWPDHYTNAIYSDDGGQTWHASEPFPANGTGEATVAELTDGQIYYNSRRHWAPDKDPLMRHIAWSYDGGETWEDMEVSDVLPDGPQNSPYGLMAGLVRLPVAGRDILIFSNVESDSGRQRGTIWASDDGGQTWPYKRLVDEGSFAYSSLAAGRPGTPSEGWIYLQYESGGNSKLARFNLTWLLQGKRKDPESRSDRNTVPGKVRPPYKSFSSVEGTEFGQTGNRFYINTDAVDISPYENDGDDVSTIYLEDALGEQGEATVMIEEQEMTDDAVKAGLMVRNDITGVGESKGFAFAASAYFDPEGYVLSWDDDGNGLIDSENFGYFGPKFPAVLKLEKENSTFTMSVSTDDGSTFQEVGQEDVPDAASTQDVGLFATKGNDASADERSLVEFSDFSVDS